MKKNTSKLEAHLERHPSDANGLISLLKARSHNFYYDYELEKKRKAERGNSFSRKQLRSEKHAH